MSVLLLRLCGPMQSWGDTSRFDIRDTRREPTKSGVVGLLAAALGRRRSERVDDLAALRMGVRVDHEGVPAVDYQTAGGARQGVKYGVAKADGSTLGTVQSWRHYLADAEFLVGLEGSPAFLKTLNDAIVAPTFPLFLGRKGYVPSTCIAAAGSVHEGALLEVLCRQVWPSAWRRLPRVAPEKLRLVLDSEYRDAAETRRDFPIGAAFETRRMGIRYVETVWKTVGADIPLREE